MTEKESLSENLSYEKTAWGWRFGPFRGNRDTAVMGCHGSVLFLRHIYFEIAFRRPFSEEEVSLLKIMRHDWFRSDEDRDLHDHPWPFISFIAKGGCWEEEFADVLQGERTMLIEPNKDGRKRTWRSQGSVLFRKAGHAHAVRLAPSDEVRQNRPEDYVPSLANVVSYVVTGPRIRQWGFWTNTGWIDWITYGKGRVCD